MTGFEGLLIGRSLAGRYRVEEVIGRGGMSVVFRARDERLSRDVAVKVLSLPGDTPAGIRTHVHARLKREAHAAAGIPGHPNVVQIHDFGTDPELDLDFIVMELLRGRDLKEALAEGPLPRETALRVLRDAGRGVAAGHAAGIVHRDVKPGNVFLVGTGDRPGVRILDFGIAKALQEEADQEDLTALAGRPRTPAYASPEQIRGEATLTPASDVFQLGLVAFEALTGERALTRAQLEAMGRGEAVPLDAPGWRGLPEGLRAVLRRSLDADPARRYPDAGGWTEALARASEATGEEETALFHPVAAPEDETVLAPSPAEDRTQLAPPDGVPPRADAGRSPAKGWRSRRLAAPAGGAVGLLLILAVVWLALGGGGEPPLVAAPDEQLRAMRAQITSVLLAESVPDEGADAAALVRGVIDDLNRAWLDGDIDRHASHYAPRVSFYDTPAFTRARIAEERGAARDRYDDVEMEVEGVSVTFPAPGEARVRLEKRWDFSGPEERWHGAAEQEMSLQLREGIWLVTVERDVDVHRSEREVL
jgi:predicted Ser/Thr protein kinase